MTTWSPSALPAGACGRGDRGRFADALRYVIGTEVPVPGGAHETLEDMAATSPPSPQPDLGAQSGRVHGAPCRRGLAPCDGPGRAAGCRIRPPSGVRLPARADDRAA
ncbi:hypothetical protein E4K10_42690 [Streptomyces sp. T1317-0309]|nr:hypothetical protein E4K10_42690 [Streptomyces sp. T1317-0309]